MLSIIRVLIDILTFFIFYRLCVGPFLQRTLKSFQLAILRKISELMEHKSALICFLSNQAV